MDAIGVGGPAVIADLLELTFVIKILRSLAYTLNGRGETIENKIR